MKRTKKPLTASQMAKKRWRGTTAAQRKAELKKVRDARWGNTDNSRTNDQDQTS